ncbi:vacuolar protein sorting-associated protein 13B [Ischnura elegans]|uniref:vacuolar protein sorting-associated protein 13B n=1 Tax=Ischnura elegans TaxID=197161 RepID=UPI001ED877F0|nr:vacuolar protein sorting-associated protein 13B [Ischnura elegans]
MNQFITPILLGYVDRYIKNFQPKDWQVSLWEGDATFNNLELRPEVLEEDFKVPFSLVSGQIYELLIHVPWTRLTWEPVVVTLNTIECILKLRSGEPSVAQHPRKRQDTENHPSYIQGLVSKILNNITVVCNNLSVKYIEEDIVLSMHVKNLTFQAVDQHWNPTFSEITEPVLRKKISVSDLTVCLDKRNASGKIEAYHEPVLYRSSLEFRLLTYQRSQPDGNPCSVSDLHASKANEGIWPSEDNEEKFLVIRLDVCATQILDFQLNEEQLPMFFRLCELSRALAKGEIPKTTDSGTDDGAGFASSTSEKSGTSVPPQNATTPRAEHEERGITDSTKMGWSEYFTNFFPSTSEEWFSDETLHFQPQIWDFGLYVKKLSLELKIIDRGQQDSYYGPSKVVRPCTKPFAAVVLQGVSAQLLKLGAQGKDDEGARTMFNMRMGASRVLVKPVGGLCPCGTRDGSLDSTEDFSEDPIKDKEESFFIYAGGELENYDQGSLFDDKCLENSGVFKPYNCSRVCHLETVTETTMLERTPALALDFLYTVETPAEWSLESLAKLANFEDCNFSEESLIRILFGPSRLKICASFLHRLKLLMHLASQCDYPPYIQAPPPPDHSVEKSPFKTFSGQEIASKDFPSEIYRITLFRPLIQFYLDDHPDYKPGERLGKRKSKSKLSRKKVTNFEDMPSVSFQSKYIDAKIVAPMYPYRLVESWKNVHKVPQSVMDIMYSCGTAEVTDIACHVILEGRQTTAFVLNGINYIQKRLILPEYWSQKDLVSLERFIQCESLRVAATKVKLDIIMGIMFSFFKTSNRTENSRIISLIPHAISDQDHAVADLCLDGLGMKYLLTQLVEGYHISVSSLKVLLLKADASKGDLKQTLVLSGPEVWNGGENEESATPYLLKATLQKKIDSTSTNTATKLINPLLAFQINHAHLFVDQLLIDWLSPMCVADSTCSSDSNILELKKSHAPLLLRRAASEEAPTTTLSTSEAPIRYRRASTSSSSRTLPPAPPESVHSSSERGASGSKALSGGPVVFGSSSALAEVEEDDTKDETTEDCPEDHDVEKPQQTFLETVLDIFKSWSSATVVGKVKQWTAYVPAVLGDGCISSEGAENIPQTVTNAVSSGKAIGALVIDLPSISLHSAGVQGDVFLQSCLANFPMKTTANNLEKNISVNFPWSLSMSNLKINTLHSMKVLPFLKPVTTILTLGVTASTSPVIFAPGGTLNLCIHVDTSALMFSVSEIQWETITNIFGRLSLISGSSRKEASEKVKKAHSNVCKPFLPSPSSLTSIHQTSSVSIVDNTSVPCANKDGSASNSVKLAALVQWTLARLAVSLYAKPQSDRKSKETLESSLKVTKKLYMALEDLITSVDIKEVYLKIESKVASARVAHYLRTDPSSEWKPGAYLGLVMHCNEDSPSSKVVGVSSGASGESKENSLSKDRDTSKPHPLKSSRPFPLFALTEDSSQELHRKDTGVGISSGGSPATSGGFLVVTFTKAQSLSVHQKWGKLQKRIDSSNAVSSDPNVYPGASPGSMPSSSPNFPSASNAKFSSDGCLLPPFKSGANHHSKIYLGENALPSRNTAQPALSLNAFDESHYVSELSVRVQPLDIIFSPENLQDFWVIFHHISNPFNDTKESSTSLPESSSNCLDEWCSSSVYSNLNLPLLYVDAHNLRVILPSSQLSKKISELQDDGDRESAAVMGFHDVCIFQVDRLSIAPQVENPIGRLEIRPDIYGMADEARILGIPGSLVEDRQYLVQVHNISISTGMWYELQPCFEKDPMVSSTHMRSENPALEWSKLAKGKSCLGQELSVLPLVNRFDFTITAAPAIVYRVPYDGITASEDILVAGYAMEMHASSNIDACVSSHQLELLAELVSEAYSLFEKSDAEDDILKSKLGSKSSEILVTTVLNEKEDERIGDSGVDVSSSGCLGTPVARSVSTQQIYSSYSSSLKITDSAEKVCANSLRKELPVPLEMFVTCEKLTLVLYDVTGSTGIAGRAKESGASRRKHYAKRTGSTNLSRQYTSDKWGQRLMRNSSDLGYDGSEEGSIEDAPSGSVSYYVHPLLHWFVTEPHAVLSLGPSSQKFQLSVFDVGVRTSGSGYVVQGGGQKLVPRLEDFHVQILETKSGERHPKTGIPPSFLTITWTDILSPSGQIKVEVGRPVKVHGSVPRWKYLRDVFRRLDDSTKCLKHGFLGKEAGYTSQELELTRAKEDGMLAALLPYLKNSSYTFVTDQLVISVELVGRNNGIRKELLDEVTLALSSFHCNVWSTEGLIPLEMKYKAANKEAVPNRVHGNVKVSAVTASITHCGRKRVLLYPWSFGIDGTVIWEPWMNPCHPPRIQLNADSETILVELGPDHLVLLNTALSDFQSVISPERSSEYLNDENGKESDSKEDMISAEDCHDSLLLVEPVTSKDGIYTNDTLKKPYSGQFAPSISYHSQFTDISCASSPAKEQHYQDDLRAGAFIFLDNFVSHTSSPFPYQVIFNKSPPTMTWCYPEPRTLTRVDVYPVPFVIASESMSGMSSFPHGQCATDQVICSLQYWCDCRNQFNDYCHFQLSESSSTKLDLPSLLEPSRLAIARIWRVQLQLQSKADSREDGILREQVTMSPRSLVGCMRVDSYFSPSLIPAFEASLNLTSFRITFSNHLTHVVKKLPKPLHSFTYDDAMPDNQPFCTMSIDGAELFFCVKEPLIKSDQHPASVVVNFKSHFRLDVIDYAFLTQQCVIEPFLVEALLALVDTGPASFKTATFNIFCKPITIHFGAAPAHTFFISMQLWKDVLKSMSEDEKTTSNNRYMTLVTRYIICNDTMQSIRFGQTDSHESIQIDSRQCHFYSWFSQKQKQALTFSLERSGKWMNTLAVNIDYEGTKLCRWDKDNPEINLFVNVESLSATQKKVTVMGQLMVTNLLMEPVDLQIPFDSWQLEDDSSAEEEKRDKKEVTQALVIPVAAQSTPASVIPSLLATSEQSYFRIRFQGTSDGLTNGAWSGKVPLLPDTTRDFVSYPVKVPLHERNHYYCVWCRVVYQKVENVRRILVVISPLFAVRSYLPISADVEVTTPDMVVKMRTVARGRGTDQEIYCPGTTETKHVLEFILEGQPPFSVPMSYQMLKKNQQILDETEQSKGFFKASSIEEVLKQLQQSFREPESKWPYVGEEFNGIDWIAGPLSQTDIQISYVNPCYHCNTLLVQVSPKVLLVNVLGIEIYLTSEVEEVVSEDDSLETIRRVSRVHTRQTLCSVPHHGVIAAPKLEGIFHLGIRLMDHDDETDDEEKLREEDRSGEMFFSPPMQLSTDEWAGNKPHISGVVPLEGSARTRIFCGKYACFLVITSMMTSFGVRVLTVRPMYTLCNHTLERFRLSALSVICSQSGDQKKKRVAVPHSTSLLDIPPGEGENNVSHDGKVGDVGHILGWPIILWTLIQPSSQLTRHDGYSRLVGEQRLEPYIQLGMDGPSGDLVFGCPLKVGMPPENPSLGGIPSSSQPKRVSFTIPLPSVEEKDDRVSRIMKRRVGYPADSTLQVANRPFVMTMHEKEGQSFLVIHDDPCPQLEVLNLCSFDILIGQVEKNDPNLGPSDSEHLQWLTVIQSGTSAFYSLPSRSSNFPDIYSPGDLQPPLVLAGGDFPLDEDIPLDMWSECVQIDNLHLSGPEGQFVRLFPGRDVRVRVAERQNQSNSEWGKSCLILLTVEPAPRASVLAKDVRERLGATLEPSNASYLSAKLGNPLSSAPLTSGPSAAASFASVNEADSSSSNLVATTSSTTMYADSNDCQYLSFIPYSLSFLLSAYNYGYPAHAGEKKWQMNFTFLLNGASFSLMDDLHPPWERKEAILLSLNDVSITSEPADAASATLLNVIMSVGDCQLDNQQHVNYDFPVILVRDGAPYNPCLVNSVTSSALLSKPSSLVSEVRKEALLTVIAGVKLGDSYHPTSLLKTIEVNTRPMKLYLEDTFDLYLMDICLSLLPSSLLFQPSVSQSAESSLFSEPRDHISADQFPPHSPWSPGHIFLPQEPFLESLAVAKPLRLKKLSLSPASLLVSLHTYAGVYIAANHSPLQFSSFVRTHLFTSSYELGRALTVHYRSGVLLCAGWVLGSLELLGSPGGLACTVGRGIRDFLHLPLAGILQGPWGFVLGVLHGSASLMKHITAGTVTSVTMLASSVARNLDQLTLDEEHRKWSEEVRRRPPKGVAQGLLRGLTGLGISLLGAVGGIVYHPMQSMVNEGSQGSIVSGVGKGLVGVITKPLSGAAELVALTGQGLLHGTGWSNLPLPRQPPLIETINDSSDSQLKYIWKILPLSLKSCSFLPPILFPNSSALPLTYADIKGFKCYMIMEAMSVSPAGVYSPVTIILTTEGLLIVKLEEQKEAKGTASSEKPNDFFWISLREVSGMEPSSSDPTLLRLQLTHMIEPVTGADVPPVSTRSRIAEYVRDSSLLVCPVQISGPLGVTTMNDWTFLPPAPQPASAVCSAQNVSPISSRSQSPSLPRAPRSSSPVPSTSSARSSFPSLAEKSGSCSGELSDQHLAAYSENICKLQDMVVQPGLPLMFHVAPAAGVHFLSLLKLVKRQSLGKGYPVL